jgi:hypothetical protein
MVVLTQSAFAQSIPQYNIVRGDMSGSTGYYFLNAFSVSNVSYGYRNIIMDKNGEIVYIKTSAPAGIDFKVHPNKKISYVHAVIGNPAELKFIIMDSTFFVKDTIQCKNGALTDAHELLILPNGHYLLFGFVNRVMNLSSYYWFNGNGSPGSSTANVKCGIIQELDENKNLVFSWNSADHYLFGDVQQEWLFSPTNVDWTHFNAIEVDTDGNLLISVRHFSEITKINRQTGAIMWRFGGKRNQFAFSNDPFSGFYGQHDIRRIPGGNITLFDNGRAGNPVHPARGLEYNINEVNLTTNLVWSDSYSPNSISNFMGSTRRLSTGSSVIGWGSLNNSNSVFTVVKPNGENVMDVRSSDDLISYRVINFPSLPWQINRPVITCRDSAGSYYLDAPSGHASYLWSTGATGRSVQLTAADTYYVYVPYGQGGYVSSERVIITNLANPCQQFIGIGNISENVPQNFILEQNYPNPFNPVTKIKFAVPSGNSRSVLKIFDAVGREIETIAGGELKPGSYEAEWNASVYPSGIYFYVLTSGDFTETKKMVLIK